MKEETKEEFYFHDARRAFYFIALFAFTISLLFNQVDYFHNKRWALVILDSCSVLVIYLSLLFFIYKKIEFSTSSAIFIYTTVINISLSTWYQYLNDMNFTANLFFNSFIYSIYIVLAGFCIGRKNAYSIAAIYAITFLPLIFISGDGFLLSNGIVLTFLMIVYSFAVTKFLYLLDRSHSKEMELKEEISAKDKAIFEEQKKRLNFQLEAKQREIMAQSMFLVEYSENNNSLIRKLDSLKKHLNDDNQKLLNEIIQEHRSEHFKKNWKEFESSFLEVHPEFYKKLHSRCPALSPAELKLAALIHLGLSSKQIGSITSSRPESVDVARSRLRNKLGLHADINLPTFFMNL